MLEIKNLHVCVEGGVKILKGLNLTIPAGEIHAIMGPNGSGKSTLSYILSGREGYEVLEGEILYKGENLLDMSPDERSRAGVFLAFQYPVEIPGVQNGYFLRSIVNAQRIHRGLDELNPVAFMKRVREGLKLVKLEPQMLKRSVNEGFSGGEKKRNEILQMSLLEPSLSILDETDSGLDIDALKIVGEGVDALKSPERSFLIITHYQRLLDYVIPDRVHVLRDGQIVKSGDKSLALELETRGYEWLGSEEQGTHHA
jgi:Fe-S cluster assembly ATP-binding protein